MSFVTDPQNPEDLNPDLLSPPIARYVLKLGSATKESVRKVSSKLILEFLRIHFLFFNFSVHWELE